MNRIREFAANKLWNRRTAGDLAVIAAVIAVLMLIAYKANGIYPFGDETIARGDMVQQTIPAGMYYVWDILHGDASPFFTWNSGFGMNISGAASLGALLSPLNLLLYFSPRDNLADFVNILLILKMICVAGSMYFYIRKYDTNRGVHITAAVLYSFGAAALVHFQIILVLEAAFFLPLLVIGLERIIEKKSCWFLILMLAMSMVVNVYTGGILLIFLFLLSGFRIFMGVEDKGERRRCVLWLGLSVLAALLLSAVFVIPALLSIMSAPRSGDGNLMNLYKTAIQHTWDEGEWKTVERMLVNTALPVSCILLFRGKGTIRERLRKYRDRLWVLGLMLLSVLVSGIELLWHGGSRALWPVRFVFIISFVLIDFAVLLYQDRDKKEALAGDRKIRLLTMCGAGVGAVLAGVIFSSIYTSWCEAPSYSARGDEYLCILIEVIFIVLYCVLLNLKKHWLIGVFVCIEIVCTSVISFAPNKDNATVWSPECLEAASNTATGIDVEIKDFERVKNTDYALNQIEYSLVLGEEAVSNYWHVISPALQPAFAALGYTINWTQLIDTGGTAFTDTLFHIQYYLSSRELPEDLYDYDQDVEMKKDEWLGIYKNKFELPFAIGTDVPELGVGAELFANQNSLFAAMTGDAVPLITDVSGQLVNGTFNLDVGSEKKILYFYGTNRTPVSVYVNGVSVKMPSSYYVNNEQYPSDFCNGLVRLGCFENQHVTVQIAGGAAAQDLHLGLFDYNMFVNGMEKIKNGNPEIVSLKQKNEGLSIELGQTSRSNIFIPVSYDDAWVCRVNGKKVSELGNLAGMISIPVEKGKNNKIELSYHVPGRTAGVLLSLGTLILIVAVWVIGKKKKFDGERPAYVAGYAAYVVFAVLYAAFLAIMFVIPVLYRLREALFASA